MTRASQLWGFLVFILAAGIVASYAYAQSATGRALLAYKDGITPEQENADRAECHNWAVMQSGFDPQYTYPAFIVYENAKDSACFPSYEHPCFPQNSSGLGGAYSSADIRRLNDLYVNYLKAGQVCLEAKGYTVATLPR